MIYTSFSFLSVEKYLKEIERLGTEITTEKIKVELSYSDLPKKYGKESDTHRALKKLVHKILQEYGEPIPQYESAYYDVYSTKFKVVVECGDTPVDKIPEVLFRWNENEVWCLGYPNDEGYSELIKFKKKSSLKDLASQRLKPLTFSTYQERL